MDQLNDVENVEREFVDMLDRKVKLQSLGDGAQGAVKKIKLENGIFYAVKAYEGKNPKQDYERESYITKQFMKQCNDYLVCFSGSVVHDNKYWLITQFLDGYEELLKLLTNETSLLYLGREGRVMPNVNIYINMIKGLEVLHGLNISHHDIKPENILVNIKTSNIKYIDFGMACCMERNFKCGQGGSPAYAAPEISEVDTLDKSKLTDLWSLGCVIYACEYGQETLDDPEGYYSIPPRQFNRKGKLTAFLRDPNVQGRLKFERNGFAFDLTKLLNMNPAERTLDCYKKTNSTFAILKASLSRWILKQNSTGIRR